MKNYFLGLFLLFALFSCKNTVRVVVDAEGDGSFDFKIDNVVEVSGEVHGNVDSLTATADFDKNHTPNVIKKLIEEFDEVHLAEQSEGNISGLVRVYINDEQVAHIPFTTQPKQTVDRLAKSGALRGAPPTFPEIQQVQTWGETGIGFAYIVGIRWTNNAGQVIETDLDSGGCLWHTTATDIPSEIPDGTSFTVYITPHACSDGKAYSPEVFQVKHGNHKGIYFNVWGNCFTDARIGAASYIDV